MERIEQMYWVSERGLMITLPPHVTRNISSTIARGDSIDPLETHRLALINEDPILKRRHPQGLDGCQYMGRVDLDWRSQLLQEAEEMSAVIRTSVPAVIEGFTEYDFAIILFGSIARGLCRNRFDEDPSNVDLSVIGEFSEEHREAIFDNIRPARERGKERIGNNIGVFIQTPEKLVKDGYSSVLQFISSCAQPLHDPGGIWQRLEQTALEYSFARPRRNTLNARRLIKLNGNGHEFRTFCHPEE